MRNYKKMIKQNNKLLKPLTEDEEEEIVEDIDIEAELTAIAEDLGYTFMPNKTGPIGGTISVSDELSIFIRYNDTGITRIYINFDVVNNKLDCTKNTTTADNMSVELQTCVLIIKDIKQKLM